MNKTKSAKKKSVPPLAKSSAPMAAAKAKPPPPPAPPVPPAKPKIPTVRFQLSAPKAVQVFLAGTFNDWDPASMPMTKKKDGTWTKELKLEPGSYEYLFLADGQWMFDPGAEELVPNPFGGNNCLLLVA